MADEPKNPPAEVAQSALDYMPLARRWARHYAGRGADAADLAQDGYLILCELISRRNDQNIRQPLPLFLSRQLRGRIRNAAARYRCEAAHESLETLHEENGFDLAAPERNVPVPPETLNRDERELFRQLAEGARQSEIAARFGISQPTVSRRIAGLRRKLRE